jgi:small subunit ribosomal protein S4
MSIVKSAACRQCRREKEKLFLKGQKCFTDKCPLERKPYAPGQRAKRRVIETEYFTQLREKQKAKKYYGLAERQFAGYYRKAVKKKGITGEVLLQLLETRLDNIVYLMGFATSRAQARQLINHGHVTVDGNKLDISSYPVREGQEIGIAASSTEIKPVLEARETGGTINIPDWLESDLEKLKGKVVRFPEREDIQVPINEQVIIELYSR